MTLLVSGSAELLRFSSAIITIISSVISGSSLPDAAASALGAGMSPSCARSPASAARRAHGFTAWAAAARRACRGPKPGDDGAKAALPAASSNSALREPRV